MKINVPTVDQVIKSNKFLCEKEGNAFTVLDRGKVESAIHTAFYPGSYPYSSGGIARIAGALCFYLVQAHAFMDGNKRVGSYVALRFMNLNGWDLKYVLKGKDGRSALANIIEGCASGKISKDELIEWFDNHKVGLK